MNPAGSEKQPDCPDQVRMILQAQGQRIRQQEELMGLLRRDLKEMAERQEGMIAAFTNQLNLLAEQLKPNPANPDTASGDTATHQPPVSNPTLPLIQPAQIQLSRPEKFSGDSGDCRTFITQCELHFEMQPTAFLTDRAKIAYIISHLTGRAEAWATAEWNRGDTVCTNLPRFIETLNQIFHHVTPGREAARALVQLKQGEHRVIDYAIQFRTLAADSGWNPIALFDAFLNGLNDNLKDQLAPLDLPKTLDELIALAIKIDRRLTERELEKFRSTPQPYRGRHNLQRSPGHGAGNFQECPTAVAHPGEEEPMQLGRTRLTPEERQKRFREGRCIYCGLLGHLLATCPAKARAHQ